MTAPWQLWLLWGFAVGIGTGSLALVFGAIVANRWFVQAPRRRHRRLLGGQLDRAAGVPARDRPPGRRAGLALGRGLVAVFALALVPLVLLLLRDRPEDVGTTAYGAPPGRPPTPPVGPRRPAPPGSR